MSNQKFVKILTVVLVIGLLASGSVLGFVLGYARGISGEDWSKLDQVLSIIENSHISDTDRDKLLEGALRGMVDSLGDPYSTYMDPDEINEMQIISGGSYSGIGVEVIMENNRITIMNPFPGSPAEGAGLMPGDQIVEVDGMSLEGMSLNDAVKFIRGEAGTELTLGIMREGRPNIFRITMVRAEIRRASVEHYMLSDNIGFLHLSRFAEKSYSEFTEAIDDLKAKGMEGLVLDLRGNPGGYLDVVVDIAGQVVPSGLVVYTVDSQGRRIEEFSDLKERGYPLVVLINEYSASASEILAGALKDSDAAVLVGQTTYGKGTVQRPYPLGDGSVVKLTMARFYTPAGIQIDGHGVIPHHEVVLSDWARLPALPFLGTLEIGSDTLNVLQLQKMLTALDYFDGEVNGLFNQATADAVAAYQRQNSLAATGKVDLKTTESINQRWQTYTREADSQLNKALEVLQELIRQGD